MFIMRDILPPLQHEFSNTPLGPKGFRRTRNFGFLHPNSKRLIQLLQLICKLDPNRALAWFRKRPPMKCTCCGGLMTITKTRIRSLFPHGASLVPT